MRHSRNGDWFGDKQGNLVGIDLGADYCAEHEWGIDKMKSKFQIKSQQLKDSPWGTWWKEVLEIRKNKTPRLFGIESRMINHVPENLIRGEHKIKHDEKSITSYYICLAYHRPWAEEPIKVGDQYLGGWLNDKGFNSYWGEEAFFFTSPNKERIDEMWNAFQNKDIALFLGGGGPFQNAGLTFLIASKLDKSYVEQMHDADKDHWELLNAAVDTGIYQKLEKADCGFYACKPSWKNKKGGELQFWLNPADQQNNEHGWYTVKDLEDWTKGKGKIPQKQKV